LKSHSYLIAGGNKFAIVSIYLFVVITLSVEVNLLCTKYVLYKRLWFILNCELIIYGVRFSYISDEEHVSP
jgi:hypothetical protein